MVKGIIWHQKKIVLFTDEDLKLEVPITPEQETVWLTQEQMSVLFDTARSSIAYHIGNIFKKENSIKILLSKISTEVKTRHPDRLYTTIWM